MKKDNKASCTKLLNIIFISFYFFILLGMVAVLVITFCRTMSNETKVIVNDAATSFGLIITSMTIMFASSIIVPKFMLKQEVDNAVEEKINDNINKQIDDKFEKQFKEKMNLEILKTDAHLSRMIALFLTKDNDEKYEIWSIGWCFRSLKRYQKLENVGIDIYNDLIKLIGVVFKNINNVFNTKITGYLQEKEKEIDNIQSEEFFKYVRQAIETGSIGEKEDKYQTAFRAVKDAVDFDFDIDIQKEKHGESPLVDEFKNISENNSIFIKILLTAYTISYMEDKGIKSDENKNTLRQRIENPIFNDMYKITSFSESNKSVDKDVRKKFQNSFNNLLSKLLEPKNQEKLFELYRKPKDDNNNKCRILDTKCFDEVKTA